MNSNIIEATVRAAKLRKTHAVELRTLLRDKGEGASAEALTFVVTHATDATDIQCVERYLGFNLTPVAPSGNEIKVYEVPHKRKKAPRQRNKKWYSTAPLYPQQ